MLNKLSMKLRLMLVIGPLTLMLGVIGGLGLNALAGAAASLQTVYADRTVALGQLAEVDQLLARSRGDAARPLTTDDKSELARSAEKIEKKQADIEEQMKAYLATYLTEEERVLATTFGDSLKKYVEQGLAPAAAASKAGERSRLQAIYEGQIEPLYAAAREQLVDLKSLQVRIAREQFEAAQTEYASIRNLFLGLIVLSVLYGAAAGLLVVRNLTGELGGEPSYAREVVRRIAAGDLSTPVQASAAGDGSLLHAMQAMQKDLARTVGQVKNAAELIGTASKEIAQGNTDLSVRTEQQASSLEETASSMEELTATVKQNAENARQANQLAIGAGDVAGRGGSVVQEVVHTMSAITDSSKKIVDIISVIDGIAFQTNILALNAAVEAARAGEQGRGFAVVAAEVRSLAQRSAGAAKEIKSLISDSVEKVTNGSRLVETAGKTMNEIVQSVKRVTDIMGEITAASQEQSTGIEQVNTTVTQMDQVTQQNSALVEEAAASAKSLEDQAEALVRSVGVFKLTADQLRDVTVVARPATLRTISTPAKPSAPKPATPRATPAQPAAAMAASNGHGGELNKWVQF
jgi:methyl-accepting chemotaxis protein